MIDKDDNTKIVSAGERFIVEDRENGSKGIIPIVVDEGYSLEVIKVDEGILHNALEYERACDFMLIASGDPDKHICMAELKGTDNEKEISHAYTQISQSIKRIPPEFIKNADYMMAAIAGAQDKTLPSMINKEKRDLCKLLFAKSTRAVNDMNRLVFYVQPNAKTKKAYVNCSRIPRVIECHSRNGAEIPVPSLIIEAIDE